MIDEDIYIKKEREYMVSWQRCLFFPVYVVKVTKKLKKSCRNLEFSSVYIQLMCWNWFSVKQLKKAPNKTQQQKPLEVSEFPKSFVKACSLKRLRMVIETAVHYLFFFLSSKIRKGYIEIIRWNSEICTFSVVLA